MKSVLDILETTESFLAGKGFPCPRSDAQWLLAHVLGLKRLDLYMQFERPLTEAELDTMRACLRRRASGEPIQYIVGSTGFYTIELAVGPGVLIPRPETERLVELALKAYPGHGAILDLCTGTGAVILALARELPPTLSAAGVDVSAEALVWATRNRDALGLSGVRLLQGDLFEPVAGETFSLITANPPYVTAAEYDRLPRDVHDHEPRLALIAGEDGLDVIRRLVEEAPAFLEPGGHLLMEIGELQGAAVTGLLREHGWQDVQLHQDYTQRDRVVAAARP